MTIAGFSTVITTDRHRIAAGCTGDGSAFLSGLIEFHGHLTALKRAGQTTEYKPKQGPAISVEIEFVRQLPPGPIGTIQLLGTRESAEIMLRARVSISLPFDLFMPLSCLAGRAIKFDAVHNERASPYVDNVFAEVERVYFDNWVEEAPYFSATARRRWFW